MRALILFPCLVLALTACKPFWDPTYYPSGYANQSSDNRYKSPPGPATADIGYEYSADKNAEVNEAFLMAARDLALRAKANEFVSTRPFYLKTDLQNSAFSGALDNALRVALREQGMMLTQDAALGTHLFFSAYEPGANRAPEYIGVANHDDAEHPHKDGKFLPANGDLELVLIQLHENRIEREVSATANVPLYDFRPAGYLPPHTRPLAKLEE